MKKKPLSLILLVVFSLFFPLAGKTGGSCPLPQLAEVQQILQNELPDLESRQVQELALHIVRIGGAYDMDPILILALIKVESDFKLSARSHRGALGLMQIRPIVLKEIRDELPLPGQSWTLLMDPYQNITVGVHYFNKLLTQFDDDVDLALTAYNMGPTAVGSLRRAGRRTPQSYARRVQAVYEILQRG